MKIILNQDVPTLGEEGDVKIVANGYARNYLIPKKMAIPYNKQGLKILEAKKVSIEKRKEEKRVAATDLKERLEAEEIVFQMSAGESGKLFGSVSNTMVADELTKRGYSIDKKRVEIPDHTIRNIGSYNVQIKLYENKEAVIKLKVEKAEQKA
ncbi:MAG: 50S ribosomal protein L9 [Spirochaetales bacterium]|nr:50S ribosomal protein L9 [Spirochaetales bacterium]